MKIITIVGARPQFIKASAVSKVLRTKHTEIIIHTGQHYDASMSDIFFDELNIPKPDYRLDARGSTHAKQTAIMLEGIEEILINEKPDYVLVYGDTNSTLAGALSASKLHIPVIHVEAGIRSYNKKMPEEQNRVLTDHISSFLLCPTQKAVSNLKLEGLINGVYNIGDVMFDSVLHFTSIAEKSSNVNAFLEDNYCLLTTHREENTNNVSNLVNILKAIKEIGKSVVFPIHPRTSKIINDNEAEFAFMCNSNIQVIEPVSYFDMLILEKNADVIITDSGGVQKEAFFFKKPCITLRNDTEWEETLINNWNTLTGANTNKIINSFNKVSLIDFTKITQENYFGDGKAAYKILDIIGN